MELIAENETRIYRAFITDSGTRGIGVAFPERANFTFDANELRPALIWQGPFIDAAKHRIGRGAGFEGPLGYNVVKMPAGPPLALLPNASEPWPKVTGKAAGYRMQGYELDEQRRPTFKYRFKDIEVTDKAVAVPGDLEASLRRTLTFRADHSVDDLWFRAWVGEAIDAKPDGSFLVDGKVALTFSAGSSGQPVLRKSGGKTELLVPLAFQGSEATVVEEILW